MDPDEIARLIADVLDARHDVVAAWTIPVEMPERTIGEGAGEVEVETQDGTCYRIHIVPL